MIPITQMKVVPKADAIAVVELPAARRWLWRTTLSTAVPIEPPTRCRVVSCGVASLTWSLRRTENAAVIAGIIESPMPIPRRAIAASITT